MYFSLNDSFLLLLVMLLVMFYSAKVFDRAYAIAVQQLHCALF
ncbi:MAG: hypothetical protein ACI9WS_000557, partial [Paraglaciecola psychrophila]